MNNNFDAQLSAILAQGNPSKTTKKEDQKFSNDELMKKYFVPFVPKGQRDAIFKFRIIPTNDGTSPFKEVKFHVTKIGGKWQKLLCLKEHGQDCPLCDTAEALTAQGDKEEAKKYRPAVFYIVRGIERGKEHEGVKFWRFRKNYKNKGEFDKIVSLCNIFGNIVHPQTGYDLTIECGLDDKGNSQIRTIACVTPSPISSDDAQAQAWINDDTTWKDVFRPKTSEYLTDVVYGRAAYWDDAQKKFIRPGAEDAAATNGQDEMAKFSAEFAAIKNGTSSTPSTSVENNPLLQGESFDGVADVEDDDMPF